MPEARILDGSVIADFESFFFVHHCQSRGACLITTDLNNFPSFPMVVEYPAGPRLKPRHRHFASLSSPAQMVWGT